MPAKIMNSFGAVDGTELKPRLRIRLYWIAIVLSALYIAFGVVNKASEHDDALPAA